MYTLKRCNNLVFGLYAVPRTAWRIVGMNILTKTTLPQTFTVTPIKPHIGAEITGIDLTQAVDEVTR